MEPKRLDSDHTKERWTQLEKDVNRLIRGRATPGSGNKYQKGDVQNETFIIECKYRWEYDCSDGYFFPLDIEWLETIWNQAQASKKIPVFAMEFGNKERGFLIPFSNYKNLGGNTDYIDFREILLRRPRIYYQHLTFPSMLILHKIEIPEIGWVILDWDEFKDLCDDLLPEPKPKSRWNRQNQQKKQKLWKYSETQD